MKLKKTISAILIALLAVSPAAEIVRADVLIYESDEETCADSKEINFDASTDPESIVTVDENAGELLVLMKDGVSEEDIESSIDSIDMMTDPGTTAGLIGDGSSVIKVEVSADESTADVADLIMQDENVEYVQENFMYELLDAGAEDENSDPALSYGQLEEGDVPDDPSLGEQWQLDAVNAYGAWEIAKCEHSVTVAVIDSGVNLVHEDLAANLRTDLAYQAVVADNYIYTLSNGTRLIFDDMQAGPLTTAVGTNGDQTGHGTQVAGLISAVSNNHTGVSGISYNADVLPVNVINRCINESTGAPSYYSFTEHVIRAYDYLFDLIDEGTLTNLKVINLSLGGYGPSNNDLLLEDYIRRAKEEYGIISVCAGGNKGNSSAHLENGKIKRICPGDCDYAVSVVSVNKSNYASDPRRTATSDFNDYKDIAAPGDSVYTTKYSGSYGKFSGTSAAAPVVTGVFSLLFAYDPNLSADRAVRAVCNTARDITGNANNFFDSSAVCSPGWDMYTGYGLINARAALLYLMAIEDEDDMVSVYDYQEMYPGESLDNWLITESGVIDPEKISFRSSSPSVASVDENGVITVKKPGLSVITASSVTGEKTASVTVRGLFFDVPSDHNYYKSVYWAFDNGITSGYTGYRTGYFGVGDNVTRGQAVQFLWRLAGKPEPERYIQPFKDVPLSHSYYRAIQWAFENGIAAGYSGKKKGTFGVADECTRGQIAVFLWRYAGKPVPAASGQVFSDVPESHAFYKAVQWGNENRIMMGYSGDKKGIFGVNDPCTRGHMVTFVYRMEN